MRNIFKSYAKTLEKIAHLMPPDLNRFLDQESQVDVNFLNLFIVINYISNFAIFTSKSLLLLLNQICIR